MSHMTDINRNKSRLGGQPRSPVWDNYHEISATKVRCNKCLSILVKRIDRVKVHEGRGYVSPIEIGHNPTSAGRSDP